MRMETQALAEAYRDRLFAAAFQVCGNAADADDAAQEALLRYHTSEKQFESEQHIRAWLLRVAINCAKNVSRSFWRRNIVPLEEYMDSLEFDTGESRQIFLRRYWHVDTIAEIAARYGITESKVKMQLSRTRAKLCTYLEQEGVKV